MYEIKIGVVDEVDASNGSVKWLRRIHLEASGNPTDSTDRFVTYLDFTANGASPDGLNLDVNDTTAASEKLYYVITNLEDDGQTTWQTDTGLASPAGGSGGTTGRPGAGDLVMLIDEVSGSGTLSGTFAVRYYTI